jgi:hypothetical protein
MAIKLIRRADLEVIHTAFYTKAARKGKIKLLNLKTKNQDDEAFWLLRHHDEREISDEETWVRDDVDYLLSYYAILQVGITAGVLDLQPNDALFESASELLNYPPLVHYFTKSYPLELPDRMRARFEAPGGPENLGSEQPKNSTSIQRKGLFSAFLPLTALLEQDNDMEAFLWLLDGGWRGQWHDERLEKALRHPKEAATLLMDKRPDPLGHRVMQGAMKFIEFAVALDILLDQASDFPDLQEEMYLFHSYWFSASEGLTDKIVGLLDSLASVGGEVDAVRVHFANLAHRARTMKPSRESRKRTKNKYGSEHRARNSSKFFS